MAKAQITDSLDFVTVVIVIVVFQSDIAAITNTGLSRRPSSILRFKISPGRADYEMPAKSIGKLSSLR